jgi:hypothetical protein
VIAITTTENLWRGDARHRRDTRRGEGAVSGDVGEGEDMTIAKVQGAQFEISINYRGIPLEQAPKYLIRDNCNRQCIQIPDPSRVGHVVWNEQTVSYLSSTFVTMRHEVKKVRLSVSIPDALPVSTSMTGIPCSR